MVCGSFEHCWDLWVLLWVIVQWSVGRFYLFSVFPPPIPYFSSFHCFISVTACAWNGGSWLCWGDLPAIGTVFYLGAGWPPWKTLGIPHTHLPLKQGSWLNLYVHKLLKSSNSFKKIKKWKPTSTQVTNLFEKRVQQFFPHIPILLQPKGTKVICPWYKVISNQQDQHY